jgi:hypothetical protein
VALMVVVKIKWWPLWKWSCIVALSVRSEERAGPRI